MFSVILNLKLFSATKMVTVNSLETFCCCDFGIMADFLIIPINLEIWTQIKSPSRTCIVWVLLAFYFLE